MEADQAERPVTKGVFGAVILLLLVAGLAFPLTRLLTGSSSDSEPAAGPDSGAAAAPETTTELSDPSEPVADTTSDTGPIDDTTAETGPPTTLAEPVSSYERLFPPQEPSGLFDVNDPTRRAVMKSGVVYLGGEIRSGADADTIAGKVAKVVGPDNVYMEYRINPDAPLSEEGILEVAELVLFESGSAVLRSEFTPLLDLGVALMATNPDVTIFVRAHTDTDGPAPANLALSEARAQAIVDYWIASGIDPARVSGEGKGETQPIADESEPGGAALNRRAEFVVRGLLG